MNNGLQARFEGLDALPAKISRLYDTLNDERAGQLADIKTVKEHIYNTSNVLPSGNSLAHGALRLPDISEQAQTLKAHILESLSSHPEGLFDVFPADLKFSETAQKQKAMLVSALENMKISDKLEQIVTDLVECGESIVFIGWKRDFKKIRRAVEKDGKIGFITDSKLVYDGPALSVISPENFVFDTGCDFSEAAKIFRSKRTLEELLADKNNNFLTPEIEEELRSIAASKAADNAGESTFQSFEKLDILEFWGDIKDEKGNVLQNQLVVIAEKRYIIRFEENPYLNCPFIYGNILENPFTGRGISPLRAAIDLNKAENEILNTQLRAYSLIVNPPYLAPKGAFKGEQQVKPGKIIEYDTALLPQMPTPLNFSQALCGWDFIKHFKGSIESTTGIFRTMAGELEGETRTATELNMSANGQSARLNMFLDVINRKIIVPIVQKTADIISNFKFGTENLLSRVNGELRNVEINDNVRFGDYIYRYSDRKASLQRKKQQHDIVQLMWTFGNTPQIAEKINWEECFKLSLGTLGVENVEMYLNKGVSDVVKPEKADVE